MHYVYFISDGCGAIKIGIATEPVKRLKQLQIGNPNKLYLIGILQSDEGIELEKQLHIKYKEKNIRGEWFRLEENQIDELHYRIETERKYLQNTWDLYQQINHLNVIHLSSYSILIKCSTLHTIEIFADDYRNLKGRKIVYQVGMRQHDKKSYIEEKGLIYDVEEAFRHVTDLYNRFSCTEEVDIN